MHTFFTVNSTYNLSSSYTIQVAKMTLVFLLTESRVFQLRERAILAMVSELTVKEVLDVIKDTPYQQYRIADSVKPREQV